MQTKAVKLFCSGMNRHEKKLQFTKAAKHCGFYSWALNDDTFYLLREKNAKGLFLSLWATKIIIKAKALEILSNIVYLWTPAKRFGQAKQIQQSELTMF